MSRTKPSTRDSSVQALTRPAERMNEVFPISLSGRVWIESGSVSTLPPLLGDCYNPPHGRRDPSRLRTLPPPPPLGAGAGPLPRGGLRHDNHGRGDAAGGPPGLRAGHRGAAPVAAGDDRDDAPGPPGALGR